MKIDPRYNLPPGTELTLHERPMVVTGQSHQGYMVVGSEDGASTVISYAKLVEHLKLPGAKIDTALPLTGGRAKERLGGFATSEALSEEQLMDGRFHYALCEGVRAYRAKLRIERGDPNLDLSQRKADLPEARKFIANTASQIFGEKISIKPKRGGKARGRFIYRGRTLIKYFNIYESLEPGESPIDALVPLDHLKGNTDPRICFQLREMMTEAWEKVGFDLRHRYISNVKKYLETKVKEENQRRERNGLTMLVVPASQTLAKHRDALLTPTELTIATKGIREARNKRGRGSTDIRSLLVGELVEIDECKISLVTSAKVAGVWERLSQDGKGALERLDHYIRSRLWILVMIDVATRMPLAWVITENPNAEATLALFRMATRDKDREKHLYRCSGEPAAAVGLMHVKNDNGPGLRNSKTVGALMGMGSTNSVTRSYSSTDRAVVERFFGTLEIDIFRMLPGYTGGRPDELPGYDALANGVITVEQLHEILTRYFIDEYPSTRHYGNDMGGRRPADVYKTINATRGQIAPIDAHDRRIRLGWEESVTPTDEGVRVFQGIYFNSDALQEAREGVTGKVKVFIDPENLNLATVVLPMIKDPVEVHLQITAFADMTLPEVLRLMAEYRREDPDCTEIHEDRVMRTRRHRYDQISAIGLEHNLQRSYSTVEECRTMAKAVFAGARVTPSRPLTGTTRPGAITDIQHGDGVFQVGGDDDLCETVADSVNALIDTESCGFDDPEIPTANEKELPGPEGPKKPIQPRDAKRKPRKVSLRPQNLKGLS